MSEKIALCVSGIGSDHCVRIVASADQKRYSELDALRGIAVLMMVFYHLLFDLQKFYGFDIGVTDIWWRVFVMGTASIFLFVIGVCFVISWQRSKKYVRRGLIIFSGGMIISLITWLIAPEEFVKFGILHLIGISALLQPLFVKFRHYNFLIGIFVIVVGAFLIQKTTTSSFLFPLGLKSSSFASLDYYPLLPWFGVILIGMAIGSLLYTPSQKPILTRITNLPYPKPLLLIGRKALIIYFLHQPLILLLLKLTFNS